MSGGILAGLAALFGGTQRGAGLWRLHFQPIGQIHRPALGRCRLSSRYRAARTSTGLARFRRGARTQRRRRRDYSDPRPRSANCTWHAATIRARSSTSCSRSTLRRATAGSRCSAAAQRPGRRVPGERRAVARPRRVRGQRAGRAESERNRSDGDAQCIARTARDGRAGGRRATRSRAAMRSSASGNEPSAAAAGAPAAARELEPAPDSASQHRPRSSSRPPRSMLAETAADPRCSPRRMPSSAREHAAAGDLDAALEHTRRAVLIAQERGLGRAPVPLRVAARPRAARGQEAGRCAARLRGRRRHARPTALAAATSRRGFRRDVLPLYEEYADLMLAATRGRTGSDAGAPSLRTCKRNLEQLRIAEVRNYFENQCSVPIVFDRPPDIDRAVVIYPMLFADRLELLVSSGDDLTQITVPVSDAELTRTVRLLRDAIEQGDSGRAYLPHAQRLYAWLIEPLARSARASRAEHVGVRAGRAVANDPARGAPRRRALPRRRLRRRDDAGVVADRRGQRGAREPRPRQRHRRADARLRRACRSSPRSCAASSARSRRASTSTTSS